MTDWLLWNFAEWRRIITSMAFSLLGPFIAACSHIFLCVCQTWHGKRREVKLNMSVQLSALRILHPLSGSCQVRPSSLFCPHWFACMFIPSFLSRFLSSFFFCSTIPCPSPLLAFLNSHLVTLFLPESTFEMHLRVWPSFSCLNLFLHPS